MNLVHFFSSLFVGHRAADNLDPIREAGRQDARLMVGAYAGAFAEEADKILTGQREQFLGLPAPEVEAVDAEFRVERPARRKAGAKAR